MEIKQIKARQILDSRGYPTVEVDVTTSSGAFGRAAVPSGASTGEHEALELRDGDESLYGGRSVATATSNIESEIAPKLRGMVVDDQTELDRLMIELDGTDNKSRLGANAILGVSMAAARAAAASHNMPLYAYIRQLDDLDNNNFLLPLPLINIFNGGAHATGSTAVQEFMITPIGATDFPQGLLWSADVFRLLKKTLEDRGLSTTVGDEGGFAPGITSDEEVLKLITECIERAGYNPGNDIAIALDVAASEFYENERYLLTDKKLTQNEMIDWLRQLQSNFPIISIEDGLDENDWKGWSNLEAAIGDDIQLVGDDLLVTNYERLKKAIANKSGNAILIKLNQIGSLSETLETIQLARQSGWQYIISHRSGETVDSFISHLALGVDATQIKTGSLSRGERIEKYNELLRLCENIGHAEMARPFKR